MLRSPHPFLPLPLAALLGLALLVGCRSTPHSSDAPPPPETSVKPGINAEYLKPDVPVDSWVERFEREGREIYDHRDRIVAATGVRPGQRVADIGAGSGLFTFLLAEAVGPRGTVYAVDIVPGFLQHIAARAATQGGTRIRTVRATERDVTLPPKSVDLVFLCDTYHHFEYPQSTLASIHRALRPRGELFLVEFKRIPGESSDWVLGHVRAGEETFTREIEAAGFEVIERLGWLQQNYIVRFRKR